MPDGSLELQLAGENGTGETGRGQDRQRTGQQQNHSPQNKALAAGQLEIVEGRKAGQNVGGGRLQAKMKPGPVLADKRYGKKNTPLSRATIWTSSLLCPPWWAATLRTAPSSGVLFVGYFRLLT